MSAAPLSPIALRKIAAALEAGTPAEQRAAADALRELVLPASRFVERDRLIMDLRKRFFPGRTDNDAANEIEAGLNRYCAATSGWRRDQDAATCPERITGTIKGAYWLVLKAVDRPLSRERIRKIVGQFEVTSAFGDKQAEASDQGKR
jgi:hypothetical protein